MLYIWFIANYVGNKERVLLSFGNLAYQIDYKRHITQSVHSCIIVKHFIEKCNDPIFSFKYLRFVILDILTNTESLAKDDIEDRLLKKEKFWCGTLVTQHKGLNGLHDWR